MRPRRRDEPVPRVRLRSRWAERGFSAADLLNLWPPSGRGPRPETLRYGKSARQMLDVYRPRHAARAPLVVFFYGGSWQSGDRSLYRFVGASLAACGIVAVIPDYSVYPDARYPDFLEDGADAVRFVRDNAAAWRGDPTRLVLMGHSAGAYIAAMLAFDRRWLDRVEIDADRDIAGMVGLAGPYDFLPIVDPVLQDIFGGPDRIETQPIRYVTAGAPPALLVAPRRDRIVSPGNTKRLAAQIRAFGSKVEERSYPRVGHLSVLGALAPPLRFLAPVLADVTAFVKAERS